jgi:molybdopterin/thiamine biosynthesis adenylyltransferase
VWDKKELKRYERQLGLLGQAGQRRLKQGSVFIAGAGGLGTAVAAYLAAAGLGRIRVVDKDRVQLGNLNRQFLYAEADERKMKAPALGRRLRRLNPHIDSSGKAGDVTSTKIQAELSGFNVIVDALDNFSARQILNRASIRLGIPLVHGSIHGYYGQLTTVIPGRTPCLRCLFPESPEVPEPPALGPVCGVIGCLQGLEVIKYLLGKGELLANRLLVFDGLGGTLEEIEVKKRPDCPDCGEEEPDSRKGNPHED